MFTDTSARSPPPLLFHDKELDDLDEGLDFDDDEMEDYGRTGSIPSLNASSGQLGETSDGVDNLLGL